MNTQRTVCVVGATGVTGRRVARNAAQFGLSPILAGRSRARLDELADSLGGAQVRLIDLDRPSTLRAALHGADAVISCVAPYTHWGTPVVEAAVASGVDYVDTTGEARFCTELLDRFEYAARDAGVRLVPAAATSSIPADFGAALGLRRMEGGQVTGISLGYVTRGWKPSAGSLRSEIEILADGAPYVSGGQLRFGPAGGSVRRIPGGVGIRMPVPDPFVISRYADCSEIEAFLLTPAPTPAAALIRALSRLGRRPRARRCLAALAGRLPDRDDGSESGTFAVHATVWARRRAHTTTVAGRDVYRFSARAATLVAAELAARPGDGGVRAPSEVISDIEAAAKTLDLAITHRAFGPSTPITP